jgi:hypothetical protein
MKPAESTQPPIICPEPKKPQARRWLVWMAAVGALVLGGVLFVFNPERSSFYPVCVFKKATGWECPTCGCLRATHQLLHGHIVRAFHLNALFVVSLPIVALLGLQTLLQKPIISKPSRLGWALLVLFLLFGVLRNLPRMSLQ